MNREIDELIEIIENFIPFNEEDLKNDNVKFMYDLTDELSSNSNASIAINPLFKMAEKFPSVDWGSPGPIVHFIEKFRGGYEESLFESLDRKPTLLTIWMLNRIINGVNREETKIELINKMKKVLDHPLVGNIEKEEVKRFLEYQFEN